MSDDRQKKEGHRRRYFLAAAGTSVVGISGGAYILSTGLEKTPSGSGSEPQLSQTETDPPHVERERKDGEDITNYGAELNPSDPSAAAAKRNLRAILDAAHAAGEGGEIYVPEGTYYIGHDGSDKYWYSEAGVSAFTDFGGRDPSGISVHGAGPTKSTLAISEHIAQDQNANGFRYESRDHGIVEIKDIRLDGNYENLPNLAANMSGSSGLSTSGTGSFDIENVHFRGWYQAAADIGSMHGQFVNCTFEEQGIGVHNDLQGGSVGHHISCRPRADDPPVTVDHCLFRNNSGTTVNIRYGDGAVVFRDSASLGMGSQAFKVSAGDRLEVYNSYFEGYSNWLEENLVTPPNTRPFYGRHFIKKLEERGNSIPTVVMENVDFRGCTFDAIHIRNAPLEWKGDMIAIHDAARAYENVVIQDHYWAEGGAIENMEIGKLSVHDSNGEVFSLGNSSGTIETLHRDGNTGLGSTGAVDIGVDVPGEGPLQPTVVLEEDIGIRSDESI